MDSSLPPECLDAYLSARVGDAGACKAMHDALEQIDKAFKKIECCFQNK